MTSIDEDGEHIRRPLATWVRIYLHGIIASALLALLMFLVLRISETLDFIDDPVLAAGITLAILAVFPPVVGCFLLFVVFPMLNKHQALRGILAWDDRLLNEVSQAKEKAEIVIINWPSEDTRTMGVMTSRFIDGSGEPVAAVYVPTAPQTRLGYIRIVAIKDVEFTNWTLRQWQVYQLTFGALSPQTFGPDQ